MLNGGAGNDTLNATVDNVRDTLDGGADSDTANYTAYAAALTVNLGGAAPIVVGGSGNNAGNSDVLIGIENFTGGTGGDTITGSTAANVLNGGGGNDTFNYTIGGGADTIIGGAGNDTLNIAGAANNDVLDVVYNGVITGFEGGTVTGVESITANLGGNGDTLSYGTSATPVTVNLLTGAASGFTSIASILNVTGGTGGDNITGNAGANTLIGGDGNDTINGGAGGDIIIGGVGADILNSEWPTTTRRTSSGAASRAAATPSGARSDPKHLARAAAAPSCVPRNPRDTVAVMSAAPSRRALAEALAARWREGAPPGSNRTMFGRWFGVDGVPWCAIFVSYCFDVGAGVVLCRGWHGAGVGAARRRVRPDARGVAARDRPGGHRARRGRETSRSSTGTAACPTTSGS